MDITERKQVEYMIQESEKLYRAVVEDQNELICRFLSDGTITFVNQAYCRYFNMQAEDLIGNNWLNLIPLEYREKSVKLLAALQQLTPDNPVIVTEQWVLINGEKCWQQWTDRAIFAEDGTIKEFQGLGQDITEKRKAEVALKQSEETLKLAQKIANLGNWEYDIKTNQNCWSEEIYNIFGKNPAEFVVTVDSFLDCIHPEDQEFVRQEIKQALINKKADKIDYRIIVNNKIKYVQEYANVILDETGEVTRIIGTIQDITELKLKEQALKESEASFRSIFENAAIGIAIVDLKGHFFHINHKFIEFIDYSEEELIQINLDTIIHPEDIFTAQQYFQESLRGLRDYFSFDQQFICKNGVIKWGNISVSLVRNIDRKAKHFIIIIDDISLRKEAQIALEEAKQAAEDANLAKSQFLANMSHELRTPLNAILGFTQLMVCSDQLIPQHQEYLQIINRAGEHLLSLINDILSLSKIEAGKIELCQESFDLANLLNSIKQMLEIKAQAKKLALIFEIEHQPTGYIVTDYNKLSSVLINIIGNAIKFTNQGSILVRTKTNYLNDDQVNLIFEIEDTGVGIDPVEIDQLFDVFTQAKSGKESGEGSGLGLAISQRFVNLMGGTITVKSKVNHGSIFTFNIICDLDKNKQNIPTFPNSVVRIKANQPQNRILIVEDKPINSQFLSDLLSDVGFMVQVVANGKEAISMWQTWQPDLILMDIRMPVMNGYQAIQQIRSLESDNQVTAPVKIIVVTASVLMEEKELILQAGCNDFLGKPVKRAELFAKIAHHLDVSYVYDSPPISETVSPSLTNQELDSDALLFMPESWRKELYSAAIAARSGKILELINDIPIQNKGIMDRLTFMVQQLDFETIMNLSQILEQSDYFLNMNNHD
jgi:PAS domain S-box-containing protein